MSDETEVKIKLTKRQIDLIKSVPPLTCATMSFYVDGDQVNQIRSQLHKEPKYKWYQGQFNVKPDDLTGCADVNPIYLGTRAICFTEEQLVEMVEEVRRVRFGWQDAQQFVAEYLSKQEKE